MHRIDTFQALLHVEIIVHHAYPVRELAAELGITAKTLYAKLSGDSPMTFCEALAIVRITGNETLRNWVLEQIGMGAQEILPVPNRKRVGNVVWGAWR